MYVRMYVLYVLYVLYVCTYVIHTRTHIHTYIHSYVCMHVCTCRYMYVCMNACHNVDISSGYILEVHLCLYYYFLLHCDTSAEKNTTPRYSNTCFP